MFALIMTILAHSLVMFAMKYTETSNGNRYAATLFTYVTGIIITFALMGELPKSFESGELAFAILMAAYNGLCMTMGMILCRVSMKLNGAPISTTFNRLGVLIPASVSIIFFGEMPRMVQILGIALAVFAIIYINTGDKLKKSNHIKSIKFLLLIFVVGGMIDLNTKVFDMYGYADLKGLYQFITFISCALISFAIMLFKDRSFSRTDILVGGITGIPNTFILYFSIKAVEVLPAYIVFPAYSAGVILVVNVVNYLLFKENLSREEKIATLIIAIALILINI